MSRIPVPLRYVIARCDDLTISMCTPDRCEIAKQLFWTRGIRVPRADQIALEIFISLARKSDVIFDIGSSTGIFSIFSSKANPTADIYAFDIVPEAIEILQKNIIQNDSGRVVALLQGIGDPSQVFVSPKVIGGPSLPTAISSRYRYPTGVQVPFFSLDSLSFFVAPENQVLVKIDVEGTEDAIFEYGAEFIKNHDPIFLCEILSSSNTEKVQEILSNHMYFFNITNEGLVKMSDIVPNESFRDWLFFPKRASEQNRLILGRFTQGVQNLETRAKAYWK